MNIEEILNKMGPIRPAFALALAFAAGLAQAQTTLPDFVVTSSRVANQSSAGTIDMPVSALRYEPRVDVQSRNLAEAQADVAIRGGHFESTGFQVGGVALGDPQTGHYTAEIPVPPAMLRSPEIVVGSANAAEGFNAAAGTVRYAWRPIEARVVASAAAGDYDYNRQSLYAAAVRSVGPGRLGADVEWARSEGEGSVPGGDHDFARVAGRLQWRSPTVQTDLFVGYQQKFFGWPNLYTPFGFQETEDLQTFLGLLSHRWADATGNEFSIAGFYRRNKDDYEFNRVVPGASNPFLHTTWLRGVAWSGRRELCARVAVVANGNFQADHVESTSLTFGRYNARRMGKASLLTEVGHDAGGGEWRARAGAAYDDSDRDAGAFSPIATLEFTRIGWTWFVEYSGASQMPTYTALNSSATSGLFRGNADLGRSVSRNLEAGVRGRAGEWEIEVAGFRREDDDLVDWTFRRGVTARSANPIDLRTDGLEIVASRRTARWETVVGYTWLGKQSDYGSATVDASFYALNFPRHRVTAALTWRIGAGWELRSDNEYRVQEENYLRTTGGDEALLSSLGVYFSPPDFRGWEISLLLDNVWQSDFQEVPAVPAARRQWALGVTRAW